MTQSQATESLEARDTGTSQLPRNSVALSHDTYEGTNVENSLDGGLPSRHLSPANGETSAPYTGSQDQSSNRTRSNNGSVISPPDKDTLGWAIRGEILEPTDTNLHPFLPRDKLVEILTEERIIQALGAEGGFFSECQQTIARDIISPGAFDHDQQPHLCSRLEILATLALVDKVPTIGSFIDEGLFDYDLPFRYVNSLSGDRPRVMKTSDLERKSKEIKLFYEWSDKDAGFFEGQQWKVHVPVFTGLPKANGKPSHYTLDQKAIAPYISKGQAGRGGFSAVDKVELHAEHVPPSINSRQKAVVAIKELDTSKQDEFNREVAALNRFAEKDAPHLIQLLWTFSLGQTYHLVFPCADGNLLELWKSTEFESPLAAKDDHGAALWFSRQCLGIVEGLNMIHQSSNDHNPHEPHNGGHGNLKPENILWFRDSRPSELGYSLGTLKISDFGRAVFRTTQARSYIGATYRAPELEIRYELFRRYDIWSLACVLLEFTTWYLKGWHGVEAFSRRRKQEDRHFQKEDTFFNINLNGSKITAQAKQTVADEVQSLYEHAKTSDFIIDFVEFLDTNLLRIIPESRVKCCDAVAQFRNFFDWSSSSYKYCLDLTKKRPSKINTDLSFLESILRSQRAPGTFSPWLPQIAEIVSGVNQRSDGKSSKRPGRRFPPGLVPRRSKYHEDELCTGCDWCT